MYLAGHSSNIDGNIKIKERLADKLSLARKIKASSVCKAMSMETISRLVCMVIIFYKININYLFRYKIKYV